MNSRSGASVRQLRDDLLTPELFHCLLELVGALSRQQYLILRGQADQEMTIQSRLVSWVAVGLDLAGLVKELWTSIPHETLDLQRIFQNCPRALLDST